MDEVDDMDLVDKVDGAKNFMNAFVHSGQSITSI